MTNRAAYIWVMVFGTLLAGVAFAFKIAEFLHTLESTEVEGFVVVPVTIYFVVAAGYVCLFLWAWSSGHFRRIEEPKYRMLEQELEYERLEEQGYEPRSS
jgi:nitrogen fixation-related uncharacterized protein